MRLAQEMYRKSCQVKRDSTFVSAMEAFHELTVCPVTAKAAVHELSACPVTAMGVHEININLWLSVAESQLLVRAT